MIKLSEKAKIIIAVMAVIAVAAGAVAVTALSASANDIQNNLNANGSQGGAVTTVSDKTQIEMPEIDSGGQDQYTGDVLSYIQVINTPSNLFDDIIDMTVVGTDFAGNTMPESDVTIADVNAFDVTRAGNYTVTLTIRDEYLDQYEWEGNPSSPSVTVTYTVKQRLVVGSTSMNYDDNNNKEINYSSSLSIQDVLGKLNFTPSDEDFQTDKYTLKYGVFLDSDYTTQANDADLHPGAKYYVKATDVLPFAEGDAEYLNYRLPQKGEDGYENITTFFSIAAPSLPRPVITNNYYLYHAAEIGFPADKIISPNVTVSVDGDNITAPYLGFTYKISQWFYGLDKDNWTESVENEGHDYGSNWTVTVNGNVVDPNTYDMVDAGIYNVNIKPKGNYKFTEKPEYNYVFTIKPFVLGQGNVEWIDRHHVYSGSPISLGEDDYKVVGLFGSDALTLQFERTVTVSAEGGGTTTVVEDSAPVNAGRYVYRVKAIDENACSKNYALPSAYITNVEIVDNTARGRFIIYKKTLDNFKANGPLISGTFNGQSQDVGLYDLLYPLGLADRKQNNDGTESFVRYIKKLETEAVKRSYPSGWGLGSSIYTDDASFEIKSEALNDEFFRFTYAGSYTVVLVMETGFRENHCWAGKSDDPDSANNEQYVWTNFALIERAEVDPLFTPTNILTTDQGFDVETLIKEKFNGLGTDTDPVYSLRFGKEGETGTSATPLHGTSGNYLEGRYYVTIELDSALYPSVYFKAPQGSEYTVSGNTATVYYEVTSSTVSISCDVKPSYTFGDNFDAAFKVVTVTTNQAEGVTYNNTTVTFYDESNNPVSDASLLVNGSPRNAGKYYVVITVDYTVTGESGSEDLVWTSQRYSLTVNKRQLTVSWSIEGGSNSFTYDGTPRDVSVTVGNTLTSAQDVSVTLNNATVTNAGTHSFSVDDSCLEGTEAANYTLAGVANVTFTVTIARKPITVTANKLDDITYGGNINEADLTFDISFDIAEKGNISVAVYNSLGALLTNYVKPNRGSYTVVPVWDTAPSTMPTLTDGKYSLEQGNYVFEMQTTTFEVASQSINITLKTDGSGVYGDAIDLWALIESVTSGRDTMTVDELKPIAYVTATKGSLVITADKDGVTLSSGKYAGVGSYRLDVKPNNEDYRITVTNSASYSITPRPVTYVTKEVIDHRYGNLYDLAYSVYELADGSSLMEGDTLNVKCRVLSISEENGRFTTHEFTSSLDKQNVGTYYQIVMINNTFSGVEWGVKEGAYYYEKTVGNYRVTAVASRFVILPRLLTLTFNNASLTYGDGIDLWKRQSNFSDTDPRYYSTFDYVTASGLRYDVSDSSNKIQDNLKDVITLSLYADGKSFNPESDKIGAATYGFKATIKNDNYKLVGDSGEVSEIVKGQFVVNKKPITVNTATSVSSIVYGSAFNASALGISVVTANGLVNGDTVSDLGITLGIFSDESNVTENMQEQNVGGNYVVDITAYTNGNYQITVQNKAKIAITKRAANVTANDVLGHVYGNAYTGTFGFTAETKNGDRGFLNDAHWQALNITASVSGNVASLAVKDGGYPITLTIGNTSHIVNSNYEITIVNGTLEIVKREITITAKDVTDHVYGTALGDKLTQADAYSVSSSNGQGSAIVNDVDKASLAIRLQVYDKDGNPVADSDVATLSVGTHSIHVLHSDNANYTVKVNNATFKVITLQLTVTYNSGVYGIYGNAVTDEDLKKVYSVTGTLLEGDALVVTATNGSHNATDRNAPVGGYAVKVTAPSGNYEVTYVNADGNDCGNFEIRTRNITIQANDVTNHIYGDPLGENELGYTVTSELKPVEGDSINVTYQLLDDGNREIAASSVSTLNKGSYKIVVNCDASQYPNYSIQQGDVAVFTVNARNVTVTPDAVLNHVYGEAAETLTYKGDGFVKNEHLTALGVTAKVYDGETPVENSDVSNLHAKTYKIKLTYPSANENANYNVTLEEANFVVIARKITVTANNLTHTYGEALGNKLVGAYGITTSNGTGSAIVDDDLASLAITLSIEGVSSADEVKTLAVKNGGYVIDVNYNESNTDYDVSVVAGTFTVEKRVLKITFTADGGSSVYGEAIDLDSGVYTHDNNLVNGNGIKDVIAVSSSVTPTSNVGEYPVTITVINNNYDVSYNGATTGKYNITKRSITVTPSSFTHTYGDALGDKLVGAYGVTTSNGTGSAIVGGDLTKLAIALAVYDGANKIDDVDVAKLAVKEGGYTVKASYAANGNYVVDTDAVGTFTVQKRVINVEFVNKSSFYGDALASDVLNTLYTVGNLVEGEHLSVTAQQGEHSLTEAKAPAGTYVVTVTASNNYTVVYKDNIVNGSYVINKKVLTAQLKQASVEYREDGSDYHNGAYGATLNAEVILKGLIEGDSLTLGSGYSVAYALKGTSAVPNKAGEYDVTVTITNTNYTFANGETLTDESTLKFEITKKVIQASDLAWNETMKVLEGTDAITTLYVNYIPNYIDAIMELVPYDGTDGVYKLTAGNTNTIAMKNKGDSDTANSYYFKDGMLYITAQGRARYGARFKLTATASNNYVIDGANQDGIVESVCFIVDNEVKVSITTQNWQYGDEAIDPVVTVNGQNPIYGLTYQYARLTASEAEIAKLLAEKEQLGSNGFELSRFDGLYDDLSNDKPSFDVGYYLICVTYDGMKGSQDSNGQENIEIVTVTICDFIEVSKKQIEITLDLGSVKFSGVIQYSQKIALNGWDEVLTLGSTSMGSDLILGKDVKTYTKEVAIKKEYTDRYVWKDSMNAVDDVVTVTWTITIDDTPNKDNSYFAVGQIAETEYGQDVVKSNVTFKKNGYEGSFIWYYALKDSFTSATDKGISWTTWTDSQKPVNAGSYFVKLTYTDGGKNFTDKHDYGEFTIDKATLYLTPGGTMVYGNIPAQRDAKSTLRGFVGETGEKPLEEVGDIVRTVNKGLIYVLVDEHGNPLDEPAKKKMEVDTYRLIVLTNEGFVVGLEADNYNIVMGVEYGDFTVTRKSISVTLGNASGQFGVTPDLTNDVTITYAADENGDKTDEQIVVEGIRNALKIRGNVLDGCGTYAIYADYNTEQNKNFVITYDEGEYTVEKRQVKVTLNGGGGTYGKTDSFTSATIASVLDFQNNSFENIQDNQTSYVITIGSDSYTISVIYNGTANDGTEAKDSVAYPTHAGSYTATVKGSGSSNFEIIETVSAQFVVDKFEVDKRMIEVQEIVFTGKPLSPDISVKAEADFTSAVFTPQEHEDFIEARDDYEITLKLNDFNNYKWSDSVNEYATVTFVILKAGIYATPTGNIVYGTAFNQSTVEWRFVYAANGAVVPDDVINEITIGSVEFVFDGDIDRNRPAAGTYKITCQVDASGRIIGLTHSNFNITLKPNDNDKYGDYVVSKKAITIVAGSSSSIYSQNPADYLSNEFTLDTAIDGNALVEGESLLNVITKYVPKFRTTVTADSKVGNYAVTADVEADNYAVSVTDGTHEILPIEVKLILKATNGSYHGTAATYGVAEIAATNISGYDFSAFDRGNLSYYFTGIDGTTYGNNVLPTDAGKYAVTVTAINNVNGNFIIDPDVAVVTATFEIAKMVIDENSISIANKVYNGREQAHGLANGDGYTVSSQTFKNVGSHDVTLSLTNADNYEWSEHKQSLTITKTFQITKAKLQLQPAGELTYGESFESKAATYGFKLIGLLGDDENADNRDVVSGTVKYLLANGIDGTKLAVKEGGYVMTADVSELTSDNYEVEVIEGVLTVNKRAITIKPVSSESVYGEPVVVSQAFTCEQGSSFANGDDATVIEYLASTTANAQSDAGEYAVTIVLAKNDNYNITPVNGKHVIKKAKVGVSIRPINGTYGDENNRGIEFMSVVLIKSDGTIESINGLTFQVKYEGTANDKSTYSGNVVPTKAGIYTATVIGVENSNYELDSSYGDRNTVVEIFKRQIDADKITATSASYTGKAIVPHIEDTLYNVDGEEIYNVLFGGSLIDVGTYDLTLSLLDTFNYAWVDNLNRTATIEFKIVKADNSLVDKDNPDTPADAVKVVISDWTFDEQASKPQAAVSSGEQNIVFEYATSENGSYTTEVPKDAGEYWVRAVVAASDNYNAFVSKATKFVIAKKVVNLPVASNLSENSVYTGSMLSLAIEGFDDHIMSLTMDKDMYRTDVSGKLNLLALNAGTYTATFRLRNDGNYAWASDEQTVDGAVVVTWTIDRQIIKRLPDATSKMLVNGEDIVFIPEGFNSGIMTIENNVRAHEGNFSAIVTLKDTDNYAWEGTDSASIAVNFELTGTNTAFIAAICVVSGLCVGLAAMALILTLVNRRKKRKEAEAIDARSRADGWEDK